MADDQGWFESYIQVGPQKWIFPDRYLSYADFYRNFEAHPSDVWVCGFMRSGTTMTQDIVWLLTHNLDFERAKAENTYQRILNLTGPVAWGHRKRKNDLEEVNMKSFESLKETGDHRVVKSHWPFSLCSSNLLSSGAKIIYVLRYVKDVVKSSYVMKNEYNTTTPFQDYWKCFRNDLVMFGPYWEHIKQGVEQAANKNVLIVCYEDLIENQHKEIRRIAEFLGKDFSEEEINSLQNFMKFDTYKTNFNNTLISPKFTYVIGQRESWKKYFTEELNRQCDKWIEENGRKIGLWNSKYGHYQ